MQRGNIEQGKVNLECRGAAGDGTGRCVEQSSKLLREAAGGRAGVRAPGASVPGMVRAQQGRQRSQEPNHGRALRQSKGVCFDTAQDGIIGGCQQGSHMT